MLLIVQKHHSDDAVEHTERWHFFLSFTIDFRHPVAQKIVDIWSLWVCHLTFRKASIQNSHFTASFNQYRKKIKEKQIF